jgi:cysteine desulfurase
MKKLSQKTIYLDYAATTPVRPEVVRAMAPYWSKEFGNPSALYKLGVFAKAAIEQAREQVAGVLSCRPKEVIFTAGGSESANLAIVGSAKAYRKTHPRTVGSKKGNGHIITSKIEHHAVLHTCQALETEGFAVTYLDVDEAGLFNLAELQKAIRPDTFLVSLMYANNEIGTIEPIAHIGSIIRKINANRNTSPILFHTDACQAAGYLDISPQRLHVDLLTLNGSKLYGPKQTGCLYARKGVVLEPVLYGGGQEKNLRSGTENVPGVVGFAKALELASLEKQPETKRLLALQEYFISRMLKAIPKTKLNGPSLLHKKEQGHAPLRRLPNNVNVSFSGVDGEALVLYLDAAGIAAATGSACTSQSTDPSHVLLATGLSVAYIRGSIRFTFGKYTTKAELAYVLKVLPKLVTQQRRMKNELAT